MNKNVKRIVAMALAVGTVSAAVPATNANLLTTKAYASIGDVELNVEDEDGDSIDFYDSDDYEDEVDGADIDDGETYYVETSSDEITFDLDGADGGDSYVRIFEEDADSDDDGSTNGSTFSIDDDQTFLIRVYDDDEDEDDVGDATYGNDDSLECEEYTVEVEYTGDDDDDDDSNDYDEFDSLDLLDEDGDSIQLYEDDDYDYEVDSDDVEEGETYYAETSSDTVSFDIDGDVDDEYIKVFKSTSDSSKGLDIDDEISVSSDKILTVRIYEEEPDDDITYEDDEDVIGEYTIDLEYTGDGGDDTEDSVSASTGTNNASATPNTATNVSSVKANQWVQVNGIWQYNDAMGSPIKNSWFYDRSYGKNYFLQADGSMATGWLNYNGKWYYMGMDGDMKTGWQLINGSWYYLDSQGVMAYSTTIDGYKLGANGAWVK